MGFPLLNYMCVSLKHMCVLLKYMYIFLKYMCVLLKYMYIFLKYMCVFIQICPVSEGYLRKIPVERRGKFHEPPLQWGEFAC